MAINEGPAAPNSGGALAGTAPPPRKRHLTRGIIILMVLTVAGVVAPFIAAIFAGHSGLGVDNTGAFQVGIRNDTSTDLVAQQCGSNCLPDVPKVSIPSGASAVLGVSSGGTITRYYLLDGAGHLVGCLPMRFAKQVSGFTVLASQAQSCPGNPIVAP